jgi:ATP-dependent DNA ligase
VPLSPHMTQRVWVSSRAEFSVALIYRADVADAVEQPPTGGETITEVKWDGYRTMSGRLF